MDPDGIDPKGKGRREAELKAVTEIYQSIRTEFSPSVPVILAGDFNGCAKKSGRDEEFARLSETDLESVLDLCEITDEEAATQILFDSSGHLHGLQIDYIFISPELIPHLMKEKVEVFRYRSELKVPLPLPQTLEQRLYLPSDHYPVVALFRNFLRS